MSKTTAIRPQRRNANKHTPRGMGQLEQSVQQDGWIGAITVAADGETFDGSARLEVAAATGFDDPIIVETDGSKPVVLKRVDIPSADDPRAVRLGMAANRVAEVNLAWDAALIDVLRHDVDLGMFWRPDELEDLAGEAALLADIDAGLAGPVSQQRKLGDSTKQIKPVLYVDEIAIFEQAIEATGLRNRGQAVIAICRSYLEAWSAER